MLFYLGARGSRVDPEVGPRPGSERQVEAMAALADMGKDQESLR
jgi:hypothetical protein